MEIFDVQHLTLHGGSMRVFVHLALTGATPGLRIVDGETAITGLRYESHTDASQNAASIHLSMQVRWAAY